MVFLLLQEGVRRHCQVFGIDFMVEIDGVAENPVQVVCHVLAALPGSGGYREKFGTAYSTATVKRNPQKKGKFRLCIDGMPILEWFKMKFKELKEKLGVGHTPKKKNRPQRELRI